MNFIDKLLLFNEQWIRPRTHILIRITDAITYVIALFFILGAVYEYGFILSFEEITSLNRLYNLTWIAFLINTSAHIFLEYKEIKVRFRILAWILSGLLYITLLPVILPQPPSGIFQDIWLFINGKTYHITLLLVLSVLHLSNGLVRLLGKRTNPVLILATSFMIFILVGMGLLLLPHSTISGISWSDALFTATSAVCVTGLSSVDLPTTFTAEGLLIIILLVQIGGIGVMTFTSFFALFFMGNTSLYNQLVVTDIINPNSLGSLFSTLLYILAFTLTIEAAGMLFLFLSIHGTLGMDWHDELAYAAFHAVSGFCNAGFSIFPGGVGNPDLIHNHHMFYITLAFLIILGSIGFPILSNFKDIISYHFKRLFYFIRTGKKQQVRQIHLYNLNTKIVLVVTMVLLAIGIITIAVFEWNNTFSGMNTGDKLLYSFFNAISLRTAGFNSVGISALSVQTVLIILFLMFIGGGAQSTAGGIKVNSFAVIILNLWAVIRGRERIEIFGRELTSDSIRRSNATMLIFILILFCAVFILSILEPDIHILTLTFECTSALSTAGSTLDTTEILSVPSKVIISFLMFIGRVGVITLMLGFVRRKRESKYRYPKEEIIIN